MNYRINNAFAIFQQINAITRLKARRARIVTAEYANLCLCSGCARACGSALLIAAGEAGWPWHANDSSADSLGSAVKPYVCTFARWEFKLSMIYDVFLQI